MTTKEKQLKMLEALDLRVGDVVEIEFPNGKKIEYKIHETCTGKSIMLFSLDPMAIRALEIQCLLNYDFEVIEYHQKTWGEYKCSDVKCSECPLHFLNCKGGIEDTLLDRLNKIANNFLRTENGNKIYTICKEMLNEVRDDK